MVRGVDTGSIRNHEKLGSVHTLLNYTNQVLGLLLSLFKSCLLLVLAN